MSTKRNEKQTEEMSLLVRQLEASAFFTWRATAFLTSRPLMINDFLHDAMASPNSHVRKNFPEWFRRLFSSSLARGDF